MRLELKNDILETPVNWSTNEIGKIKRFLYFIF